MIPYEELVVALQAWRAKQGLPISQMSGQFAPPAPAPAAAAPRTAPPAAPPPPPRAASEAELDVDEAAMLEETAYDNEGNDFAMSFGNQGGDEATSIGSAPMADYGATNPGGGKRGGGGGRNNGW